MKKIIVDKNSYELIKDSNKIFNNDEFMDKVTDYFEPFDYIFGDYSYDKLRLKGYYDSDNKNATKVNDIKTLDDYIENYCAYGAKWFLLKKIK